MGSELSRLTPFLLTGVFAASTFVAGCAVHARYYDGYNHDYHNWNGEVVYYNQWEHDTHRDHVEFKHRQKVDQDAYWRWRHDHDHDHH